MNDFEDDYLRVYERLYIRQKYYLMLCDAVGESNYAGLPIEGKVMQQQLLRMALEMVDEAKQDYDGLVSKKKKKLRVITEKLEELRKKHSELFEWEDYGESDEKTNQCTEESCQ